MANHQKPRDLQKEKIYINVLTKIEDEVNDIEELPN